MSTEPALSVAEKLRALADRADRGEIVGFLIAHTGPGAADDWDAEYDAGNGSLTTLLAAATLARDALSLDIRDAADDDEAALSEPDPEPPPPHLKAVPN